MKKAIAAFTALTLLGGCLMTGCINRHDDVEESTEETTRRRDREVDPNRDEPLHDLSSVELTMTSMISMLSLLRVNPGYLRTTSRSQTETLILISLSSLRIPPAMRSQPTSSIT